jgi:hypothetical protein
MWASAGAGRQNVNVIITLLSLISQGYVGSLGIDISS